MDVQSELLAHRVVEATLQIVQGNMKAMERTIPQQAIEILGAVQGIICDYETDDFQKIEKIVCLFEKNGLSCGDCHDF